jgi:hypothetical protein
MALLKVTADAKATPKSVRVEDLEDREIFFLDSVPCDDNTDVFMRLNYVVEEGIPILRFSDASVHKVRGTRTAFLVESAQLLIIP